MCLENGEEENGYDAVGVAVNDVNGNRGQKFGWKDTFREETMKEIDAQVKLTIPTALTYASSILLWLVTFAILGRLGEVQLAGASLGMTMSNVFGNVICLGLTSALDILFSQAYGANQIEMMQVVVQRGAIILTIACGFVSIILCNGEPILIFLGQDPELSKIAGNMMRWTALGIWPSTMFEILKRYFQAMSRTGPAMIITLIAVPMNFASNYYLVFVRNMGVDGVGFSLLLAYVAMFVMLFVFYCRVEVPHCWWKISRGAFRKWYHFMELAIPSLVMMFFEWGSFEVCLLIMGRLGATAIATQTILMNAAYLLFVLPAGVSAAAITRVGNHLGARRPRKAALAANMAGIIAGVAGVGSALMLTILRHVWPYLYTNHAAIADEVIKVSPLLAVFEITDNIQTTLGAVIKGSGRPTLGALLTAVGFWLISVPFAAYFSLAEKSVKGMWQAFILGEGILIGAYLFTLLTTHWDEMVEKAHDAISRSEEKEPMITGT